VGPTALEKVLLVCKAYTTRVGAGVFPTECLDATGEAMRQRGAEFGTTTGRPRRCGWLDGPVLRTAVLVNGATSVAVTKLDVLDDFAVIPVCVGYRVGGELVDTVPAWSADLEQAEPVYEELEGWQQPLGEARTWDDLPAAAQAYLERMAQLAGVPVSLVSVGHGRHQTVVC
jgi:adenylosuccinate synthase